MFTTPIMGFARPRRAINTYYAPDYYPYFPWDAYYGGAYYYGESAADAIRLLAARQPK